MTKHIIAWDLGATKCLAGIIEYHASTDEFRLVRSASLKLTDAGSLDELVHKLESALAVRMKEAHAICIGAAGHYDGETILHANAYPYPMTIANTAREQHWAPYAVIHDYASIVCGTFINQHQHVNFLNHNRLQPHARRVAFGIGTGLGLKDGILFPHGDFWLGHNEIGHIGITHPPHVAADVRNKHHDFCQFLSHKYQSNKTITFESVLSGLGTANLFEFLYPERSTDITPEFVGQRMRDGLAPEMTATLAWYLGLFVGTIQLIFMPEGGIWMTGGVLLNHLDLVTHPEFSHGIHATPAYLEQRQTYPLAVLTDKHHALYGCGFYAAKRLIN